jgi:peptide/nickel transport system ATP-binding protein
MNPSHLLQVEDLRTHFRLPKPHLLAPASTVHAADGVTFGVERGKTFGLVGESGCGKTTTALTILRLVEPTSGVIRFDGVDVARARAEEMRLLRRRMQIIFQDPYSSLNPRATAGDIVAGPLKIQKIGNARERSERVAELLRLVGLRPEQKNAFPHQFSGGQRQRVSVARALASEPELVVCDEPVSALDVAIQAQILNLLARLQEELNLTYLFISHDMAVVQHICDTVAVMYLGRIVEQAGRRPLFREPFHPYTKALLNAVPKLENAGGGRSKYRLGGSPPSPIHPPAGCRFHTRCPDCMPICREQTPQFKEIAPEHFAACHLADR